MEAGKFLARILGVDYMVLEELDKEMAKKTGRSGILNKVYEENLKIISSTLSTLDSHGSSTSHVRDVLRKTIFDHERQLFNTLQMVDGKNEFDKAAVLAGKIAQVGKGFFLKKEYAEKIVMKRPPSQVMKFLDVGSVEDMISKYDVTEIFSALRFIESNEWMHQTFEEVYSGFTAADFEEREIEVRVLGSVWEEIAKKFVSKKHHNLSHLKEFGVIFLNPVAESIPGKFLRDFALFLHYFHEIDFYSKLFRRYSTEADFAERLKSLLRGDVPEVDKVSAGEWIIVQRYLAKENVEDPRLFIPRVNPEAMHWSRGERDLTFFASSSPESGLRLWHNLDWVGGLFTNGSEEVVSFDLEDNAMSLVSFMEGKEVNFNYHQREAMWTKLFSEYVGGDENMEKIIIENFDKGIIKF